MRGKEISGVIYEGGWFLIKWNVIINKKLIIYLNLEKCLVVYRELDMVLIGFVVVDSLKKVGKNIFG